jgi:branched-chain amino acid transport system permease protein
MSGTEIIQDIINAVSLGCLYALFALGVALLFGVMRLINFAHGELIMVGGYSLVLYAGLFWPLQIGLSLLSVIVVALLLERVAFRPVRGADASTLLVTSFAVSYLLQNLAILIAGSLPKGISLESGLTSSFDVGELVVSRLNILTVVVTVVLLAGLAFFLFRTSAGVRMRATAEDLDAARLLGVKTNRVIAIAFALSGLLAGVSAVILVGQTGTVSSTIGVSAVLIAFIATVLGGIGSLSGAALGGFILGVASVALQIFLPVGLRPSRDAFLFGLVILVLSFRPQGLIPTRSVQREV